MRMDNIERRDLLLFAAEKLRKCGRAASAETITKLAYGYELEVSPAGSNLSDIRMLGVSVILPTYQGAGRIARALESLAAQTEDRANFEVIVISNGPVDATPDVIEQIQKRHRDLQITYLRAEVASASHARNYGLQHARYAYCTYLDDDDYVSPQFISVLLKHAQPNRLVFAKITDFDETGQRSSPIFEQVQAAAQSEGSNLISRPFHVRGILSMTCAKLAPTSCLLGVCFDVGLRSGEDVVFWTHVIVEHRLKFYVPDDIDEAVYYREVRQGSVSRRTGEFSFSVTERLEVLSRVQEIEDNRASVLDPDRKKFVRARYPGQLGFVVRFLKENKGRYQDFLRECERLNIRDDIIKMVNDSLADTLVISYCFPPFNDTSAIVMMKRIIGWQWPVRVISNDMADKRTRSPELARVISPHLASHVELKTAVSFSHERTIRAFAEQALKSFQAIPKAKAPSTIYSRAMWPASAFAAALIKVNSPHIKWTAEFSDPLVLDIHGQERKGDVPADWLASLGLLDTIEKLAPHHAKTSQVFRLAELLPYILADELVFTNEAQRYYMLSQPWLQELRDRAMAISTILPHPTLPSEYYSIGNPRLDVDETKVNIGFFGSFYATRGLREVLIALKSISKQRGDRLILHVVSSDASALIEEVNALGIPDLVNVHPSLPYFDCLASFRTMDYLLVNDAVTAGIKPLNPYLPSKLSDYLGADQPIWALAEPGSTLSKVKLPDGSIMSTLEAEAEYHQALSKMISGKFAREVELAREI